MSSIYDDGDSYQDEIGSNYGGIDFKDKDQYQQEQLNSILQEIGLGTGNIDTNVKTRDPIDRFATFVYVIASQMDLGVNAIKVILIRAKEIPNIQYKNPTCFIYGYIITGGGTKTHYSLKEIESLIQANKSQSDLNGIHPQDVIRYARLWNRVNI